MGDLQDMYSRYRDVGLVVVGFNDADTSAAAKAYLSDRFTFKNVVDSSAEALAVSEKYGNSGTPLSYIIDRDGKVVDAWFGHWDGNTRALSALKQTGGPLSVAIRKHQRDVASQGAKEITATANKLFAAIRHADYSSAKSTPEAIASFLPPEIQYSVERDNEGWVKWVCSTFGVNPITSTRLGEVVVGESGLPAISYVLHLKNGQSITGDLEFHRDKKRGWVANTGLDWHLTK